MTLQERLREIGIFNPHNMTSRGSPSIIFHAADHSRGGSGSACFRVHINGVVIPGQWYDYGSKRFLIHASYKGSIKEERESVFQEALTFVKERFPGVVMVKAPFFRLAWITKQDYDAVMKRLKEHEDASLDS